jgi:hypothetical protein
VPNPGRRGWRPERGGTHPGARGNLGQEDRRLPDQAGDDELNIHGPIIERRRRPRQREKSHRQRRASRRAAGLPTKPQFPGIHQPARKISSPWTTKKRNPLPWPQSRTSEAAGASNVTHGRREWAGGGSWGAWHSGGTGPTASSSIRANDRRAIGRAARDSGSSPEGLAIGLASLRTGTRSGFARAQRYGRRADRATAA